MGRLSNKAVKLALDRSKQIEKASADRAELERRLASLSNREREVLNGLIRTGPKMWPTDLGVAAGGGTAQPSPTSFRPTMPARIRPMQARRAAVAGSP